MHKPQTTSLPMAEERIAWEGVASSCSPPLRRLVAFLLMAFATFITAMTAVVLIYDVFGPRIEGGQVIPLPEEAFYVVVAFSIMLGLGGYFVWLFRSLRLYYAFSGVLRRSGIDPKQPTAKGLRAYSDEQLLALRSRYENLRGGSLRSLFEATFGFHGDDSFALGPLSVLPGTFEMNVLRMEWEANLILRSEESRPEISWWTESHHDLLPRQADEVRKLLYALRYTRDSVRILRRRYGYRADRWHSTVPEGKLWDAVRDYENVRRIQAALNRRSQTR